MFNHKFTTDLYTVLNTDQSKIISMELLTLLVDPIRVRISN